MYIVRNDASTCIKLFMSQRIVHNPPVKLQYFFLDSSFTAGMYENGSQLKFQSGCFF